MWFIRCHAADNHTYTFGRITVMGTDPYTYHDTAYMYNQEALLPQTDRATRCQSKSSQLLLHNCRNKLYNKFTTNRSRGVRWLQLTDVQ